VPPAPVAGVLTASILAINVLLHKPVLDALLFSLAIAVGITPQLLPAVVSTSLAAGSRQMSRRKVLVKRLVCIEDLGDIDTLFTDRPGHPYARPDQLYARSASWRGFERGRSSVGRAAHRDRSMSGQAVGRNPLDQALWARPHRTVGARWIRRHDPARTGSAHLRDDRSAQPRAATDPVARCDRQRPAVLHSCSSLPAGSPTKRKQLATSAAPLLIGYPCGLRRARITLARSTPTRSSGSRT
jgi:hypothetical protein